MNYTAGPGDAETWSPCQGHGNDPRTVERTDDDIEAEAGEMADAFIKKSALSVQHIHEPRDRLAQQVGYLKSVVRDLCMQLAYAKEGQ